MTDVMMQQLVTEENNACTNAQRPDTYLQTNIKTKYVEEKILLTEETSANSDSQRPNANSQIREHQEELICTWNSDNLIWKYFTPKNWPFALCNICDNCYNGEVIEYLEDHLMSQHLDIVKEIRAELRNRLANLSLFFLFDIELSSARCMINNCKINIFRGINNFITHLSNYHGMNISVKTVQCKRENDTDIIMEQSVKENNINADGQRFTSYSQVEKYQEKGITVKAEKDNASANADQWPGVSLQAENYQKLLSKWNPDNFVWRYFRLENQSFVRCTICSKRYSTNIREPHLERHLTKEHSLVINEIQNEIKQTWLSQYFAFDVEISNVRCMVNNCQIDIFCGIKSLTNHLHHRHNINKNTQVCTFQLFKNCRRNDSDSIIILPPLISIKRDNANANDYQLDAHSQAVECREELPWSSSYSLVWRYFISDIWPFARCNICNQVYMSRLVIYLERHLNRKHPIVLEEIHEEMRKELKRNNLSLFFDITPYDVKCTVMGCTVEKINVFHGIFGLMYHLRYYHNITKEVFQSLQRNDMDVIIRQSVTDRSNANTVQYFDVRLEYIERYQGILICIWNSNNLVWQYFTPKMWPIAKCNICNKYYNGQIIVDLENHLIHQHLKVVQSIQEAIKDTNLSSYFIFDVEDFKARCIINNCKINVFHGLTVLRDHLHYHHNINISI